MSGMFDGLMPFESLKVKAGEARQVSTQYKKDTSDRKVDLGAGGACSTKRSQSYSRSNSRSNYSMATTLKRYVAMLVIPMSGMFDGLVPIGSLKLKPGEATQVAALYKKDTSDRKVDLGAGVYKDEFAEPWVFPVVRKVESTMAAEKIRGSTEPFENHEFEKVATAFLLGADSRAIREERVSSIQTVGATGALRLAVEFCRRQVHLDTVYLPQLTWDNHNGIFYTVGFSSIRTYRYWDPQHQTLDLRGLLADLKDAKPGSVVVFHACSQNPTATDPSLDDWKQIAQLCKKVGLFVIIDCAYQGFVSGDSDVDAQVVRLFVDADMELMVAQSFSKNFGLYNERVGNLCVITRDRDGGTARNIRAVMVQLAGDLGLIPSNHGAEIVRRILQDPHLYKEWRENLETATKRIQEMRMSLYNRLVHLQTPGNWDCIPQQKGLFAFVNINVGHVICLREEYHIYLLKNGRMCLAGLNQRNVNYVAESIHDVVTSVTEDCKL